MAEKNNTKKRRRRLGDRNDGRKIRTMCPLNYISPYIMVDRNDASNYIANRIDTKRMDEYIRAKKAEGLEGFSPLHVFIAAYTRVVSQLPGINRFISRQKIFARNNIEIIFAIKREMSLNADETMIKIRTEPSFTAAEVYHQMTEAINENRGEDAKESNLDSTIKVLNYIPGLLLKFSIWSLKTLDYFGLMPKFLLRISPFHGSLVITSMGSLGIPPIYHHLYNFGNVPLFISYGARYRENVLTKEGEVETHSYIDYKIVTDERICDGHYYSAALKKLNYYLKHPELLDVPPETVEEDID